MPRDRVHPAVLAAEVEQVAQHVQGKALRAQCLPSGDRQQRSEQHERDEAPQEQDLEDPQRARELTHRDRHQGERQHRAAHPQRAAQRDGQAAHGWGRCLADGGSRVGRRQPGQR